MIEAFIRGNRLMIKAHRPTTLAGVVTIVLALSLLLIPGLIPAAQGEATPGTLAPETQVLTREKQIWAMTILQEPGLLVLASGTGNLSTFSLEPGNSNEPERLALSNEPVTALATLDGKLLVWGNEAGRVGFWDPDSG